MKILMISSEGWPLARSGALADVLVALPRELKARGHEVALAMPYYREIRQNKNVKTKPLSVSLEISLGEKKLAAALLEGRTAEDLQIFFVRCDELFDRPGIYTEKGEPYDDNAARFIFFGKAAVEIARRMTPTPDILHCHDWAAALVPVLVRDQGLPFATVLSIHHLAEQGDFESWDFALTNLPSRYFDLGGLEYFGRLNLLKGGILFADRIVVSSEPPLGNLVRGDGALRKSKHLGPQVDPHQLAAAGADPVPAGRQGLFKTAVPVEQDGLELLHAEPVEAEQRHGPLPEQRRNPGPRTGDHGDDDQKECYRAQKFTHFFPSPAVFFNSLATSRYRSICWLFVRRN